MNVTAKIKLYDGTDAAKKLACSFSAEGNNVCVDEPVTFDVPKEGSNIFLPSSDSKRNKLGLFNILGKEKTYRYRFGITSSSSSGGGYYYNLDMVVESAETGKLLYGVIIYGDEAAGQYPVKATYCAVTETDDGQEINGDEYVENNGNNIFTIKFKEPARKFRIRLSYWSRASYNACVTYVSALPQFYELDKRKIVSIESKVQMCENSDEIKYGIIPSDGTIEVADSDGEISEMLKAGIIAHDNAEIGIYAGNNLIQNHLIYSSDYDSEKKAVTFSISDKLKNIEHIGYPGRQISEEKASLWELLVDVMKYAGYSEQDLKKTCVSNVYTYNDTNQQSVEIWLKSIYIPKPYLESANLRKTIDKICTVAQLYCYCDCQGELKFVSARPQLDMSQKIAKISKDRVYGAVRDDLFPKSKYEQVEYTLKNLTLKKDAELATLTTEFAELDDDNNVNVLSEWKSSCDTGTVKEFNADNQYRLFYYEKTFELDKCIDLKTLWFEIQDKTFNNGSESEETFSSKKGTSDISFIRTTYERKNELISQYISGDNLVSNDPINKKVLMAYCSDVGKCTLMIFALCEKYVQQENSTVIKNVLRRQIKIFGNKYESTDVTNVF